MQRLLKFLSLHFASKQLVVSEVFWFHKNHCEEGGRVRHRMSALNMGVCHMVVSTD